jgi:hypothetical protein
VIDAVGIADVVDPSGTGQFDIIVTHDDGFALYINGVLVSEDPGPAPVSTTTLAGLTISDGDEIRIIYFENFGSDGELNIGIRDLQNFNTIYGLGDPNGPVLITTPSTTPPPPPPTPPPPTPPPPTPPPPVGGTPSPLGAYGGVMITTPVVGGPPPFPGLPPTVDPALLDPTYVPPLGTTPPGDANPLIGAGNPDRALIGRIVGGPNPTQNPQPFPGT